MNEYTFFSEFEEKVRKAVQTPEADAEFVKQLRHRLVGNTATAQSKTARSARRWHFRPAWAWVAILLALGLLAGAPVAVKALEKLLGYIPGVGLVDSSPNLRVLAEPVSQTRDGVTLTIEHVFIFDDRVELIYGINGIDPKNYGANLENAAENRTAFCGGVEIGEMSNHAGDAILRLPDGSVLERERTGLYPQNVYAMKPVYKASVPDNVMEMTLVLDCIPWARLGAVPENWEVPFSLVEVPEGDIVGLPVIEVQQNTEQNTQPAAQETESPSQENMPSPEDVPDDARQSEAEQVVLPKPQIEMVLEKVVPTTSNTVFYISMHMQYPDPSLLSIMPERAYLVDSQQQEILLIPSGPWQPFLHKTGSLFEYVSHGKPTDGPLTIIVEDAILYYTPLYVDVPQATTEEMSFTFDAGENPQHDESWDLDAQFEIAGYPFRVTSVKAVVWDDVAQPSYIDGSQGYEYGYLFDIQGDRRTKMSVSLDLRTEKCGLWVQTPIFPEGSQLSYTILCRDRYPAGEVFVYVRELAVRIEDNWKTTWSP